MSALTKSGWSNTDPLYTDYHDTEWGVPVHDDRTQFEFLVLEGAQAGLSWMTVLRKRASYHRAFDGFDAEHAGHRPRQRSHRGLLPVC